MKYTDTPLAELNSLGATAIDTIDTASVELDKVNKELWKRKMPKLQLAKTAKRAIKILDKE